MNIKLVVALGLLTLVLSGCGSEYSPDQIAVSSKGTFVEKGSDSEISGTFVLEKATGESLTVEIDDGLPSGDVEMKNEKGDVILSSSFQSKKQQSSSGFDFRFANMLFSEGIGNASTRDYLSLFRQFSVYDGDHFEIDRNNQRVEGNYDEGQKIGQWKQYCENGQLASDQTFKEFNEGDTPIIKKVGDDLEFTCDGDVVLAAKRDSQGQLQGDYIENHYSAYRALSGNSDTKSTPKPKYVRKYKDGEFDGLQKEYSRDGIISMESNYTTGVLDGVQKKYNRDGKIALENSYKNSVKDGIEKVYSAQQNYNTKEITRWLSEVKTYSNGALNGSYQKFDAEERNLESGAYQNDQPIGQWLISNYSRNTKTITDYDAGNFILEKQHAFKQACSLPSNSNTDINWLRKKDASTADCEYYIENGLVDINKKIGLGIFARSITAATFKRATAWSYPIITAKPKIYSYMKKSGAKTNVADYVGRTRLHYCVSQFRKQSGTSTGCSIEQLKEYAGDAILDSVSNTGTAFHQLAEEYQYVRKRDLNALITKEKNAIDVLIASGANLNKPNHAGQTPLMAALENRNFHMAEAFIDAGASIQGVKNDGKSVLGHFFLSNRNRLVNSQLKEDAIRVLAKTIALGIDTQEPVLDGKTIQTLSEENNTLFHIQTLKNAAAMSNNFKEALDNRPQLDDSQAKGSNDLTQTNAVVANDVQEVAPQIQANDTQVSDPPQGSQPELNNTPLGDTLSTNTQTSITESSESAQTSATEQNDVQTQATESDDSLSSATLLKQQADFLVTQANEHIANFRLKTPKTNSAVGTLEQLKKIDPNNENISIIERSIGEKYLSLASGKIKKGQKASAQNSLESAKQFLNDDSLIAQYQTEINNISVSAPATNTTPAPSTPKQETALVCDPEVKLVGIPLIGGQSLTAQQSLPLSVNVAVQKALNAVQKTYQNVKKSGNKITYEQATSTKPIKVTLTVSASGNDSYISVKAKTPAGIVIKKSGYKQGFCELLADF